MAVPVSEVRRGVRTRDALCFEKTEGCTEFTLVPGPGDSSSRLNSGHRSGAAVGRAEEDRPHRADRFGSWFGRGGGRRRPSWDTPTHRHDGDRGDGHSAVRFHVTLLGLGSVPARTLVPRVLAVKQIRCRSPECVDTTYRWLRGGTELTEDPHQDGCNWSPGPGVGLRRVATPHGYAVTIASTGASTVTS